MIKVNVNKTDYSCITSWDECTAGQYEQLVGTHNFVQILAILSNVPEEVITQMSEYAVNKKLLKHIAAFGTTPQFTKEIDKYLVIDDTQYKIPTDLGKCSFGQKVALDELIKKNPKMDKVISKVVSIYMYPVVTGNNYDGDASSEFATEVIGELPVHTIYPLATFFLRRYIASLNYGNKKSNKMIQLMSRRLQGLRNYLTLGCLVCSIAYQEVIFSSMIRYWNDHFMM